MHVRTCSKTPSWIVVLRYFITSGIVGRRGRVVGAGGFVGEDTIVADLIRTYTVTSLSYVEVFELAGADILAQLQNDKFPNIKVGW